MIQLILKKKKGTNSYYLSNKKTSSENELFNDKITGVESVMNFVQIKKITACDALELIEQIIAIRDFPITMMKKGDYLASEMAALVIIMTTREQLRAAADSENDDTLPKFSVCEGCGKHGRILAKEFRTIEVYCKSDARDIAEDAFGKGLVTREEREKILSDIENTQLPETSPQEVDPSLN